MSTPVFKKVEMIREAERLSQAELCDRLDISLNSYKGMIKRGSSSFEIVEKIANEWPQYAYWLLTEKTNPPMHIAPKIEDTDKVLFDVIESIDQKDLINGESFVDKARMHSAIFLLEDTDVNQSMRIYVSVWLDELKNSLQDRYFAPPVISVDPRFDFYYVDYPGSARDFKGWCDANNIVKFSLHYVKEGTLSIIEKSKIITSKQILSEPIKCSGEEKILNNFNLWKTGKI